MNINRHYSQRVYTRYTCKAGLESSPQKKGITTMGTLSDANNEFAVSLFQELLDQPDQNVIFSSMSITATLLMVLFGAKNNTAVQMTETLNFYEMTGSGKSSGSPVADTQCDIAGGPHSQFKALLADINQHTKKYTLSMANRLYGAQKYEFLKKYLRCIKDLYGADLKRVDFERGLEKTRKKMNSWVKGQTNGKIKDFFGPGSIDSSADLVMANAIYFKGNWKREFNKNATKEQPFWINENQSKSVQMMYQEHEFNFAEIKKPKMKVLEMPYNQDELSMIILLPKDKRAMKQVVKGLTHATLQRWIRSSNMQKQEMKVSLPKFQLKKKYELNKPLSDLGMKDVFVSGRADLSGISNGQLVLSNVMHEAYVEVNEEGMEASGTTGGVVVPVSARLLPDITINKPFLFCIRHKRTQTILFFGMVASP